MNTIRIDAAVSENMGNIRKNNEDNFYLNGAFLTEQNRDTPATITAMTDNEVPVFGVFDGMGGEEMGEEASFITATTLHGTVHDVAFPADTEGAMLRAIESANEFICKRMTETGARRIGTTFSALTVKNDTATVYNIGDSRVYLLRDGMLSQVSVDDTNGQRLLNMGLITKEQLATHKDRHQLTQHLGIFKDEMTIEPHIQRDIPLRKGDKLLLCSDGLTDMVEDADIEGLLSMAAPAAEITSALVAKALANGGRDNVTVMVIQILTDPASMPSGEVKPKKKAPVGIVIALLLILIVGGFLAYIVVGMVSGGEAVPSGDIEPSEDETEASDDIEAPLGSEYSISFTNELYGYIEVDTKGRFSVFDEDGEAVIDAKFSSSDEKVLEVAFDGSYTAHTGGTVTVTAELDGFAVTEELTVYDKAEGVSAEVSVFDLHEGQSVDVKPHLKVIPETAYQDAEFVFDFIDPADREVISVENGVVTCIGVDSDGAVLLVGVKDSSVTRVFFNLYETQLPKEHPSESMLGYHPLVAEPAVSSYSAMLEGARQTITDADGDGIGGTR